MLGGGWRSRKFLVGLALVLALAGGAAWVERAPLLTWYYLRRLAAADEASGRSGRAGSPGWARRRCPAWSTPWAGPTPGPAATPGRPWSR
jgi:hypothetical protein